MGDPIATNLDPDPGSVRAAFVLPCVAVAVILGVASNWIVGPAVAFVSYAVAHLLIGRYYRSRRISLFSAGYIELEQDGETHRYAVADITRVWSTGEFRPGPRISIDFTSARQIPGLDPGDSAQTLQLLGVQLRDMGRADVIDPRAPAPHLVAGDFGTDHPDLGGLIPQWCASRNLRSNRGQRLNPHRDGDVSVCRRKALDRQRTTSARAPVTLL